MRSIFGQLTEQLTKLWALIEWAAYRVIAFYLSLDMNNVFQSIRCRALNDGKCRLSIKICISAKSLGRNQTICAILRSLRICMYFPLFSKSFFVNQQQTDKKQGIYQAKSVIISQRNETVAG